MEETLDHWNERAKLAKSPEEITHFDTNQRRFEINTLLTFLEPNDVILDLGCGNGYSSNIFKERVKQIVGGDFSPEMIRRARQEVVGDNVEFIQIDARKFNLDRKFTKVITQRCLINILDWDEQKKAIHNIHNHLAKDGIFLMLEGSYDGRKNLNELRVKLKLDELTPVQYNLDFKLDQTNSFLSQFFDILDYKTFGLYEFITRIIYPQYISPEQPHYGSKFHEVGEKLLFNVNDRFPEISKLGLWVLKKK